MAQGTLAGSPSRELLRERRRKEGPLPQELSMTSTPSLPSISRTSLTKSSSSLSTSDLCSKKWTSEHRRLLHQHRERVWLRGKAKQRYIDFSDPERRALWQYFDALSEGQQRIRLETLENMLISFGLAETREEVAALVDEVDGDGSGELDFEEYLEVLRARADSDIFLVFKAMMDGSFGDPHLNFKTVISAYRRRLILDATGARSASNDQQDLGYKILNNFAALQRSRHREVAAVQEARGESPTSASQLAALSTLPFDNSGHRWTGGPLGIMWRGVCHEEQLMNGRRGVVNSRPSTGEGTKKSRRALQKPMSPSEVINGIVKEKTNLRLQSQYGTVVRGPPELDEDLY